MREPIKSKAQFFQLWKEGVLGNRTHIWEDIADAIQGAAYLGLSQVGFREVRKPGTAGAGSWELVDVRDLYVKWGLWKFLGRKFIIDSGAPNHLTTLCGEVIRTSRGLEGALAVEPKCGMRQATLTPRTSLVTHLLVKHYMDHSSQDDLEMILDEYPDHAIEFSCFPVNVGVFPHRNTIFWETRCY
jgi:hypothetical protein